MADEPAPANEPEPEPSDPPSPSEDAPPAGKVDPAPSKPPWGSDDEFNSERAWKLIEGLRGDLDKVKQRATDAESKVQTQEDATKTDQQRLEERATKAEKTASEAGAEAARLRVALKKGLTETQAKRLVGNSEEELEADAEELLESFRSEGDGQAPRRPRERLRPGAAPGADPEPNDPAKLAEGVGRW